MKQCTTPGPALPGNNLTQANLFRGMSDEVLKALILGSREKEYPENTLLVSEGQPGENLSIIVRGSVEIVRSAGTDSELVLDKLGKNDFFGEMCLLGSMPRSASVRSVEVTAIHSLNHTTLRKMELYFPRDYGLLMQNFALDLARRLRKLDVGFASRAT